MLIQKFWKKRMMVIGAMVFILTLFALNLNALVTGKVEINDANAWKLFGFLGLHKKVPFDVDGDGKIEPGEYRCEGNGINCISIYLPW